MKFIHDNFLQFDDELKRSIFTEVNLDLDLVGYQINSSSFVKRLGRCNIGVRNWPSFLRYNIQTPFETCKTSRKLVNNLRSWDLIQNYIESRLKLRLFAFVIGN